MASSPSACHNCRRRRWKCDRSLPHCLKCKKKGQICLGYQPLLRWEPGLASRGKMMGLTFDDMVKDGTRPKQCPVSQKHSLKNAEVLPLGVLTDPLVQDMSVASRKYLFYFASVVCRDLVLYDTPKQNPFRELIPLASQHPVLLQIILANSALHMSNACQKSVAVDMTTSPLRRPPSLLGSPCLNTPASQQTEVYKDALAAKQRALCLLKSALCRVASMNIDVTLAVVLLFIEFELIDSGRDTWKYHISGARTIIETLCGPDLSTTVLSPLRHCLISNYLVFDIIGSTFASSDNNIPNATLSIGTLSLLRDAEGNHCSSFPTTLLQLVQSGAQLSQINHSSSPPDSSMESKQQKALLLLHEAQSFDPFAWATALQQRSPASDLLHRTHVASAHQAAVCIYLARILLSLEPTLQVSTDLESLVTDVVTHLSFLRPTDPLFIAITWPTFIAGAETNDTVIQEWVAQRFEELWEVEPWGLIRGALEVLKTIWEGKRDVMVNHRGALVKGGGDWIDDLRGRGVDWLIL